VIELLGRRREVRVFARHADVPHGRYLEITFADGDTAMIVLDQGFGAWAPPRHVAVRHDFGADIIAQARRLMSVNALVQHRGIGRTYFVAKRGAPDRADRIRAGVALLSGTADD
jgi:DEAD/DEAH box helicase domain-containing protein